jgi:hypothetical protein
VEGIYGEGKAEFLHKVEAVIQTKVSLVGVTVQQFGFIGAPLSGTATTRSVAASQRS